jgi:hypothetical protein
MPTAAIISDLRAARATFLEAIDGLTDEQLLRPGAVGYWSVKDVMAHLVAWEAELVTTLSKLEQHKSRPPRIVEIDDIEGWNEEQYHTNASRSLDAVWADFQGVHKHLIKVVQDLADKTLDDNRRFPWMEGEPLSYLIMETAVWHEEEHADDITAWREAENI